jgi:hypothetical protein
VIEAAEPLPPLAAGMGVQDRYALLPHSGNSSNAEHILTGEGGVAMDQALARLRQLDVSQ